jgi:hypothetical protein
LSCRGWVGGHRAAVAFALGLVGCGGDGAHPSVETGRFGWVVHDAPAALLSVHGTAADDVWSSGADDGTGPLVLHFDGKAWERLDTGATGDLWWVNATPDGPVLFAGSNALFLRYDAGAFERIATPGDETDTAFGVWAAAPDDVYLVGSANGKNGFIWHYDGEHFDAPALPDGVPLDDQGATPGLFKVWGASETDVWVVGARGVVLRGNAHEGFALVQGGGQDTLFTVHENAGTVAIVGGASSGVLYESDGGALFDVTPAHAPLLQGVSVADDGTVWAVGYAGSVYRGKDGTFAPVDTGLDFAAAESLHGVWADPDGGVWAVGGDVLTPELDQGLALHFGAHVPAFVVPAP